MRAGTHHINITNNSYFADPWLFNCRNDPDQRAIWLAERRAIRYAESKGTVVVAAEGNDSDDLAHPTQDVTSPDDSTPVTRPITNACVVIPVEVPGVVGVTADGNKGFKAYYSSYGMGAVQVTAPGGDRRFQVTAAAANGRVLSTYPAKFLVAGNPLFVQDCSVSPCAVYAYLQGRRSAGEELVREDRARPGAGDPRRDGRPGRVSGRGRARALRAVPLGLERRPAGLHRRHRVQLVVRPRTGERAGRDLALKAEGGGAGHPAPPTRMRFGPPGAVLACQGLRRCVPAPASPASVFSRPRRA